MFHRESGVFKTSYAADMALYPLPIAKWAVAAFAGLFIVVAPLTLGEYYVSILDLILIAVVGALGLNILVGYTGQISIGHGAFMSVGAYTAANLVVHLDAPFWVTIPAGGLMAALIGAVVGIPSLRIKGHLPRDRHARRPADHRMDDQPRAGDLGRRAGLDPGAAPQLVRDPAQDPDAALPVSDGLCCAGDRRHLEPRAQPYRARLRGGARPGHRRRDHRHQHFPLQALGVCDLVVLCRRYRRALYLLSGDRQLRTVPNQRYRSTIWR